MVRRTPPTPTDARHDPESMPSAGAPAGRPGEPDLATLPIIGITRRRAATLLGALLAGWIVIVFARQVSDASAATGRAEGMIAANAQRTAEVAGLERELERIGDRRYVLQQARGFGLGGSHEISFNLAADAPSLPPDAPGSAAVRLGAPTSVPPLERWLSLLFGPTD
jgi:hypothetical protein